MIITAQISVLHVSAGFCISIIKHYISIWVIYLFSLFMPVVDAWVLSGLRRVSSMAHSARRDSPELPDFSILKRLARDQLIYLLEQVGARHSSAEDIHISNMTGMYRMDMALFFFFVFIIILYHLTAHPFTSNTSVCIAHSRGPHWSPQTHQTSWAVSGRCWRTSVMSENRDCFGLLCF